MREVLPELMAWWRDGRPVGMATVVATWSSAPRQPGATMLVGPDGTAVGSVSGGCVEAAVYELGNEVIQTGVPVLTRYGVSDDDAFAVGLTCGGTIELFVERVDRSGYPQMELLKESIDSGEPVAVATIIRGRPDQLGKRLLIWPDRRDGTLGSSRLDDAATDDARGMLSVGHTGELHYGLDGERLGEGLSLFVASFAPRPRLLVFGAIDFAAAVARIGVFLGYNVTVCDARPVFATPKRFPGVEVVVDWPHRYFTGELQAGRIDARTVVCVLTHDAKFDVPLLEVVLGCDVAYVGAMGSRRTHADRLKRLREVGVGEERLAKLRSPIGLDLGARTPEETAVSVAAEIIAQRWGGQGSPLSTLTERIHRDPQVA
ncbi:MAG TPA: XdhC/CoxI family protein [Candidatus Limnocylindrales bacterium]